MAYKTGFSILDFKDNSTNIITSINVALFVYINRKEQLAHVFYVNLMQGKSVIRQISVPDKNLNETLAITKSLLSDVQLRALMKSTRGELFKEKSQNKYRQIILSSNRLKWQAEYASQHSDYTNERVKEYAIKLLV